MASERRPHVLKQRDDRGLFFVTRCGTFCGNAEQAYTIRARRIFDRQYGDFLQSLMRLEYIDRATARLARYLAWVDRRAAEKEQG